MNPTKLLIVSSCITLVGIAEKSTAAPPLRITAKDIRADRELLITHPAVVDSPAAQYPGAWSFGVLIEQLVGEENAADATRQWLECFAGESQIGTATAFLPPPEAAIHALSLRAPAGLTLSLAIPTADRGTPRLPARPMIFEKIIGPWQARDGYDASSGNPWKPNLANAPFRLLAIVNRMDLAAPQLVDLESQLENQWRAAGREKEFSRMKELAGGGPAIPARTFGSSVGSFSMGYGGPSVTTDAGEGRLIFGAIDSAGRPLPEGWTVIFEYKLEVSPGAAPGCPRRPPEDQTGAATLAWARAWHRLAQFELGDHRFNEELEELTKWFTHRGPALATAPGGAASPAPAPARDEPLARKAGSEPSFAQLRSSEGAFGPGREFRQFALEKDRLVPAVLPMTPGPEYMENAREGSRRLAAFLRSIQPLIGAGVHSLPETVDDRAGRQPLLGARAIIPAGAKEFHWESNPRITREARRLFSLNTCNGCHAADTGCPDGLHVHPRFAGEAAKLSAFLRMDGKPNRFQDPGLKSSWVQQREMEDRAAILAALLEPRESRRLHALADTLKDRLRRGH